MRERWSAWRSRRAAAVSGRGRSRRRVVGFAGLALALIGSAAYGLYRLEGGLRREFADAGPPRIAFLARPVDMEHVTEDALSHFADVPWTHPTLCRDIAEALRATGWVRAVERVHRYPDRRVEVSCTFRRPVAMVYGARGCCLIDADYVRLPGWYSNDPAFKLIVGAAEGPPAAGESWGGDDVHAAVELVRYLANEPFSDQITGIVLNQPAGAGASRGAQLVLATDRAGGRIVWGSPIGDEIEENTADEKLHLLRSNYRRFGRVDADRPLLDVSVHPDRLVTPADAAYHGDVAAGR
jgi:hypothetical protein